MKKYPIRLLFGVCRAAENVPDDIGLNRSQESKNLPGFPWWHFLEFISFPVGPFLEVLLERGYDFSRDFESLCVAFNRSTVYMSE